MSSRHLDTSIPLLLQSLGLLFLEKNEYAKAVTAM